MEDILTEQLSIEILKKFLTEAPHCKTPLKTSIEVNSMDEKDIRTDSKNMLIKNKGSGSMHEWLIELIDENTLPPSLGDIVDISSSYFSRGLELHTSNLIR